LCAADWTAVSVHDRCTVPVAEAGSVDDHVCCTVLAEAGWALTM
jgi:hypothetical protein